MIGVVGGATQPGSVWVGQFGSGEVQVLIIDLFVIFIYFIFTF